MTDPTSHHHAALILTCGSDEASGMVSCTCDEVSPYCIDSGMTHPPGWPHMNVTSQNHSGVMVVEYGTSFPSAVIIALGFIP